ncbi:proline-rich receptor-like protein kinase PERK2 [Arachis ipaensis]|uniref:proline-rich receptor-like protein kinase PERK2 n=1 Tax=Arachis ipaensis TaxID=130454 RepID=UPI0007AF4D94|nr:proline-rich receptor-like protein kinase PERK2 [Arachis ipaensis]
MDTDAQGARARRFKNRDNPSSRSTLRSRATLSPTSIFFFFFSPPTAVAAAAPSAAARPPSVTVLGHQFPSPLTTTRPLSLSLSLTPLTHLAVTNPSAATPSSLPAASPLSVLPAHPPILLLSHHHPPSSPQFLTPPAKPPRQPSPPPPFTAVPGSVSAAPTLSSSPFPFSVFPGSQVPAPFLMSDRGKAIASASKKRKRSKTSTPPPSANYARNPLNEEEKENQLLPSTDPTKFPNLYCELRLSLFLRGREIMITEDALRDALLCRVGTPETCAYQQAEDHQEEDAEAPAQQDAPDTTEPPQTQEEPVPQPQSEPEPIVVPPTDPPV